jgi:predicted RNase H-like nuclease
MFVAGVDGCHAGWIAFKVELPSLTTSVEVIDLPALLTNRPSDLAFLAIDIPIGLLDGSRACDKAARKLLGQPRGTSVFAAPCRAGRATLDLNSDKQKSLTALTDAIVFSATAGLPKGRGGSFGGDFDPSLPDDVIVIVVGPKAIWWPPEEINRP